MERVKSLSIKSVRWYKLTTLAFLSLFLLSYTIVMVSRDSWIGWIFAISYLLLGIFKLYPDIKAQLSKIKEVSYDNENLYVKEESYEIQIPFHRIKDIELVSLDGLYKFQLYHHDQFGNEVICKPSIWYPINYRKIDKELDRIRWLVRKAHSHYNPEQSSGNELQSFNA